MPTKSFFEFHSNMFPKSIECFPTGKKPAILCYVSSLKSTAVALIKLPTEKRLQPGCGTL